MAKDIIWIGAAFSCWTTVCLLIGIAIGAGLTYRRQTGADPTAGIVVPDAKSRAKAAEHDALAQAIDGLDEGDREATADDQGAAGAAFRY